MVDVPGRKGVPQMKCNDCGSDYLIAYYPFLNLRLCLRCWVRRLYSISYRPHPETAKGSKREEYIPPNNIPVGNTQGR